MLTATVRVLGQGVIHSTCIKLLNRILKLKPTAQVFITDLIGVHSQNVEVVQPLLRLKLVGIVAFVSMKESVFLVRT